MSTRVSASARAVVAAAPVSCSLTERRRIVVPAVAALAGIAVPALLYLLVNPAGEAARGLGRRDRHGHGVPARRDAIVGPRCPTQPRVFLLTLTES